MCGEHQYGINLSGLQKGSSPHVRGTLGNQCSGPHVLRIIPACAGNTLESLGLGADPGYHPRMCGEHCVPLVMPAIVRGSSPHVRGTQAVKDFAQASHGIIPACAGNTTQKRTPKPQREDHPRMCGEHWVDQSGQSGDPGSSPHVRGTPGNAAYTGDIYGIIPACAGNTVSFCSRRP